MLGIVDYGMGNLLSVFHALEMLGAEVCICRRPEELEEMDRLILPGVGGFGDCMRNLEERGFIRALDLEVIERGKAIFGICLGMQAMARSSAEGGEHKGLGWIPGRVVRLEPCYPWLRVPHIGWNEVKFRPGMWCFSGLPERPEFYFVHSYAMQCEEERDAVAWCDYGGKMTAAVHRGNIFGTQFHPEKSQDHGLRVLRNFLDWKC